MNVALAKYNEHAEEIRWHTWEKFQEATVPLSDEDVMSKQEIGKHLKTLMSSIRSDTRP